MVTPYIGEIRMFAGNFAPMGWALCNGALLSISTNEALFALLGTTYGGDGRTTFALPDLRGRLPMHAGTGPGLSPRPIGAKGGAETHTILVSEMASHTHTMSATNANGTSPTPSGSVYATAQAGGTPLPVYADAIDTTLNTGVLSDTGGSIPRNNIMPFQCLNFIIALTGIYPSQT
jgi:microcystin-dependent protein